MQKTSSAASGTRTTIGVVLSEHVYAGLIVENKLSGKLLQSSGTEGHEAEDGYSLVEMPCDSVIEAVCHIIVKAAEGHEAAISAIGVAIPGLVRQGVVEEAPNLPQMKGARLQEQLATKLAAHGVSAPIRIINDADAMAAGLASRHGKLDSFIRVWTLGTGIGYGAYPFTDGVWEGGHTVVTLDDKENYCGCGGRGHLEGVMGHRAMRLRFLDMEPEEVFAAANRPKPDQRCLDFKKLWHKSLAAATASSIHLSGPGRFFLTGYNMRFLDLNMLKDYLHQMVKMSPLQSYMLEVVDDEETNRVIGAAVAAELLAGR